MSIICIGSANVDMLFYVDSFASRDEERAVKNFQIMPGGQAANIAVGLGTLGKEVAFIGNIGDDAYTTMLLDTFKENNVNVEYIVRTQKPNNFMAGIVDAKGDRQMYAHNNVQLKSVDVPNEVYEKAEVIIFTSLIATDIIQIYAEVAQKAQAKNIIVALDPGNIFASMGLEKLKPLLTYCDYLFPNKNEVEVLVGSMERISELTNIVPNVIVTSGKDGAKIYTKGNVLAVSAPSITNVVDTTGAGDCLVAAFFARKIEGSSDGQALRFAVHAASLSVQKAGAQAMPNRAEIEAILHD